MGAFTWSTDAMMWISACQIKRTASACQLPAGFVAPAERRAEYGARERHCSLEQVWRRIAEPESNNHRRTQVCASPHRLTGDVGEARERVLCLLAADHGAIDIVHDEVKRECRLPFLGLVVFADEVDLVGEAAERTLVAKQLNRDAVQDLLNAQRREVAARRETKKEWARIAIIILLNSFSWAGALLVKSRPHRAFGSLRACRRAMQGLEQANNAQ